MSEPVKPAPPTEAEVRYFRWAYALMVELAQRFLHDAHNDRGEWPLRMEWSELVGTSRSIFLHQAREAAGIDHDAFLAVVRYGAIDVDDLYERTNRETAVS